ncbi:hypothetical protein M5K25_026140 [Dendrobium thyrsiflorum]|uniref:Uncharacterized protein n=1 Tax=Dendrobium thyrsiflorum TaxID=117978 RepID=A0ABD0TWI8_DENTH
MSGFLRHEMRASMASSRVKILTTISGSRSEEDSSEFSADENAWPTSEMIFVLRRLPEKLWRDSLRIQGWSPCIAALSFVDLSIRKFCRVIGFSPNRLPQRNQRLCKLEEANRWKRCCESEKYPSIFDFLGMAAKKVDALEERLEGEMNQIKETVEERMSSMEGQVADLRDMMKKMLEFQTQSAASDAKGPEAKNINSEIHREEEEVEIVDGRRGRPHLEPFQREERGGGYGERQGYGGMEPRGAGWEHREGYYGRRGADAKKSLEVNIKGFQYLNYQTQIVKKTIENKSDSRIQGIQANCKKEKIVTGMNQEFSSITPSYVFSSSRSSAACPSLILDSNVIAAAAGLPSSNDERILDRRSANHRTAGNKCGRKSSSKSSGAMSARAAAGSRTNTSIRERAASAWRRRRARDMARRRAERDDGLAAEVAAAAEGSRVSERRERACRVEGSAGEGRRWRAAVRARRRTSRLERASSRKAVARRRTKLAVTAVIIQGADGIRVVEESAREEREKGPSLPLGFGD